MAMTLRVMPIGIVYAVWSGIGIALIALIGQIAFGQKLDVAAVLGIGLIPLGIVVLQLYSSTTAH